MSDVLNTESQKRNSEWKPAVEKSPVSPLARPPENYVDRADRGMVLDRQNISQEEVLRRSEGLRQEAVGRGKISDTFFNGNSFPFLTLKSPDPGGDETNLGYIREKLNSMKDKLSKSGQEQSEDSDEVPSTKVDIGTARAVDAKMIDEYIEVMDSLEKRIRSGDMNVIKPEEYKFFPKDSGLRDAIQLAVVNQAIKESGRARIHRRPASEQRPIQGSPAQQQEFVRPPSLWGKLKDAGRNAGRSIGLMN